MSDVNLIMHRYNYCTFYEVLNVLDVSKTHVIKSDIDYEIEHFLAKNVKKYQTQNYLHKKYQHVTEWRSLFDACDKIVKTIFPNSNYSIADTSGRHGCWANVSKPDSDFIYHRHSSNVEFSIVYYLINPSQIYGTLFRDGNHGRIVGGKENSLILFDSKSITHKTLSPPPEVSKDTPRYTIAIDYVNA